MIVTGLTNTSGVNYTGTAVVYDTRYSGTVMTEYHDMVISTLRSRGIATFSTDDGPVYEVSGLTDMTLYTEGAYSGITNDPFAKFQISGITKDDETFTFDTSFKLSDPNFISKVLGQSNFGKDRNDVPVMVEELYYNLLNTGYREGKIRGLNTELISFNSAREDSDNTGIGWYLDRYQTPDTPYVVSELRGNEVFNLFKFISISDGSGGE